MFFRTENGEEKKVMFRHNREERPDKNGIYRGHPVNTECSIFVDDTVVGHGIAMCNPVDHFDKRIGRKKSFERALRNADFNVKDRTLGWAEFWK
jgi:hypothetical protein